MNDRYKEAYRFFKEGHASGLVLFHIGHCFEAYENDAIRLVKEFGGHARHNGEVYYYSFHESRLEEILSLLVRLNLPVKIVERRGDSGQFELPKVKQIISDEEDDY